MTGGWKVVANLACEEKLTHEKGWSVKDSGDLPGEGRIGRR